MTNISSGVSRRKLPKPDFVKLPMWALEEPKLTSVEKVILMAVLSFAWERKDGGRNPCCASLREIGERAGGRSRDAVRRALKSSVGKGILTAEQEAENMPTIYRLAEPERFGRGWRNRDGGVAISRGGGVAKTPYKVEEEKVEKGSRTPPAPSGAGGAKSKTGGPKLNPRALGTSPRQLAEAEEERRLERERQRREKMIALGDSLDDYGCGTPLRQRGQMENLIRRSLAGKRSKWRPPVNDFFVNWWAWIPSGGGNLRHRRGAGEP